LYQHTCEEKSMWLLSSPVRSLGICWFVTEITLCIISGHTNSQDLH